MRPYVLTLENPKRHRVTLPATFQLGIYPSKHVAYQQAIKMFPSTPFTLKEKQDEPNNSQT
jgi:hypothetical protein